jgi:aminoglycoside phosphotransferase (APT) family kinase protein
MPQDLDDFGGLLDWPRLNAWIATQDIPGNGPVTAVTKLTGGLQNNVFLLERAGNRFVLRRPPIRLRTESNETMRREARVLKALAGTDVPHPHFHALCDDESVIGACFYVMEPLEGYAPNGPLRGSYAGDPAWRRAMGEELVKAAAKLGAVDPKAVGLETLGKPDNWHGRQVARWRSQLDGYRALPNYAGTELAHVDAVGLWLAGNVPAEQRIGIIHGDFQFPNVMFSLDAPRITGVIDWELATLGDPLLDLGWVLTSWWEPGDDGKKPMVQPWDGFLSRAELVRLYGEISGRDMGAMPWFFVLACYKLACLLEGTYARSVAGQVPAEVGKPVHAYASWLMDKAMQIIAG